MKVLVVGGTGFLGKPTCEALKAKGHEVRAVGQDYDFVDDLDLYEPETVIVMPGKIGGIMLNKAQPYDMLYENLEMNTRIINQCKYVKVPRLIYVMCGCSYPSKAQNPIREESLWQGTPDENAKYYSLGKAVNALQVQAARKQFGYDWSIVVPGNAYGPGDDFSIENGHVVAGMIRKFHDAKMANTEKVVLWGNGFPIRDFIYSEDVAEGIALALEKHHTGDLINIASGKGTKIKELAEIVKEIVGFQGSIEWDVEKPGGPICKVFDVERAEERLGFKAKTELKIGIAKTYKWFAENKDKGGVRL
jgi:GDP-L-fucose synthase